MLIAGLYNYAKALEDVESALLGEYYLPWIFAPFGLL